MRVLLLSDVIECSIYHPGTQDITIFSSRVMIHIPRASFVRACHSFYIHRHDSSHTSDINSLFSELMSFGVMNMTRSCSVSTVGSTFRLGSSGRRRWVSGDRDFARPEGTLVRTKLQRTALRNFHLQHQQGRSIARSVAESPVTSDWTNAAEPTEGLVSLPHMFDELARRYPDSTSLKDPHHPGQATYTFSSLYQIMCKFAAGLQSLGVKQGDIIAQFSENSARWLIADQGVMMAGAANAVRGASTNAVELEYIINHSGCRGLIVQDSNVLSKIATVLQASSLVRFVVVLWGDVDRDLQIIERGEEAIRDELWTPVPIDRSTMATLVFTSGTSGQPKAAQLSHGNILYQVETIPALLKVEQEDTAVSFLPPWHIYERTVAYHVLSRGACVVYSGILQLKRDLVDYTPDFMCCVPLVLERLYSRVMLTLAKLPYIKRTVVNFLTSSSLAHVQARRLLQGVDAEYCVSRPPLQAYLAALATFLATAALHQLAKLIVYHKIRKELGIRKAIICGGGRLAPHLDNFFEALEIPVLNGWGLTGPEANIRGTVGPPLPGTTIRVVRRDDLRERVPDGVPGVLLARGPGVMSGYFQNPAATEAAFVDGFFNTGDLGTVIPAGNLMSGQIILTGRAKDTITLSDGENVPPEPIENAICQSALIDHVMLVGQDKRTLGALVCLSSDELSRRMKEARDERSPEELSGEELNSVALAEIVRVNKQRRQLEQFEVITAAQVSPKPFSVEAGTLTQTMKLKRNEVHDQYAKEIGALVDRLK